MKTAWTDHMMVRPLQRPQQQSEMTAHWTRSIRRSGSISMSTSSGQAASNKISGSEARPRVFVSVEELGNELQRVRRRKEALASQVAEMEREVAEVRTYKEILLQDVKRSHLVVRGKLRKVQNPALHRQLHDTMTAELGCATRELTNTQTFESQLWTTLCASIQIVHRTDTGRALSGVSLADRERVELEAYLQQLREDVWIANKRCRDLVEHRPVADARASQVAEAETRVYAKKDALKDTMLRCAAVQARADSAQDATVHLSQSQRALLDEREITSNEFVHLQSCTSEVVRERARDRFVGRLLGGEHDTNSRSVDSFGSRNISGRQGHLSETQAAALAAVGQVLVPTVDYASQGLEILEMLTKDGLRLAPKAVELVTQLREELERMHTSVVVAVEQEQRMNQVLVAYVQDQVVS